MKRDSIPMALIYKVSCTRISISKALKSLKIIKDNFGISSKQFMEQIAFHNKEFENVQLLINSFK